MRREAPGRSGVSRDPLAPKQPREAPRDQAESDFTPLLRWLLALGDEVLAAAFVDGEGECVDYCSALPPDEARIAGAQLQLTLRQVGERLRRLGAGRVLELLVRGAERELLAVRVDEEYVLAAVGRADAFDEDLVQVARRVARGLRRLGELPPPPWEPGREGLRVWTEEDGSERPRVLSLAGRLEAVEAVLGHWEEPAGPCGGRLLGFRVRTRQGVELPLLHEPASGRWFLGEE